MNPQISIVAPMYNEAVNINLFYNRITAVMEQTGLSYEIVCVNDGSVDGTIDELYSISLKDSRVKVVDLSRNFGKEIALTAGLDHSTGDAVIPVDVDLQDPPEIIPALIKKWHEGYDVVYAIRSKREGETWVKRITAYLFYRVINRITSINIPRDTGDFRLMSRRVVDSLKQLRERHRFMKGLFTWVGYKQIGISYVRDPREGGKSKFNYLKLWNFAVEGITSFSFIPLQIFTFFGFSVALFAFGYAFYLVADTLFRGNPVPGYPSIMITILFFGGIQLTTLGILGEYVGRIYNESKGRPLYFVQGTINNPGRSLHDLNKGGLQIARGAIYPDEQAGGTTLVVRRTKGDN